MLAARSNSARASSMRPSLLQQVAAHARQQVVVAQRRVAGQRVDQRQAGGRAEQHRQRHGAVEFHDRRRRELRERAVEADDRGPVGVLARSAHAHGRRRSRPATCTARAAECAPHRASPRARAPPGRGGSATGPSGRGSVRAAAPVRRCRPRAPPRARPGFPSARPGRAPPARSAPARRGCGPGAARHRTGRDASSRRRQWRRSLR